MRYTKFRIYDERSGKMMYINDLYFFEQNFIHKLEDISDWAIVMTSSECCDNGGSEIWDGDILSNNYVSVIIEYDTSKAAYIGRFTNNYEEWSFLYELIDRGFLRSGNSYCREN